MVFWFGVGFGLLCVDFVLGLGLVLEFGFLVLAFVGFCLTLSGRRVFA